LSIALQLKFRKSLETSAVDNEQPASLTLTDLVLQDPHDCHYRIPIPSRRWQTVELVDLTKIADRLYVTTVHSKHESSIARDHPHQPRSV
jgi:hypothetical protein